MKILKRILKGPHEDVAAMLQSLSINNYLQLSCVLKLGKPGNFLRMKTKRNDKKKGEGITSLIEWSYLLLEERRFVDFWLK